MYQYPGKSSHVIQRIGTLQVIRDHLEKIEDPCGELPNVLTILLAYKAGQLLFDDNATYWAQGRMVGGPSPFSWEDFGRLNTEENRGIGGFWVEGVYSRQPKTAMLVNKYTSSTHDMHGKVEVDLTIRLSQAVPVDPMYPRDNTFDRTGVPFPELELKFSDDTGASTMNIFNDDMQNLMGNNAGMRPAPVSHLMGYEVFRMASGARSVMKIILVDVNIRGLDRNDNRDFMGAWDCIPCAVFDQNQNQGQVRLNGPWLRNMYYVATAPAQMVTLCAGTNKSDIYAADMLPRVDRINRNPPPSRVPHYGVQWVLDATDGFFYPLAAVGGPAAVPPTPVPPISGPPLVAEPVAMPPRVPPGPYLPPIVAAAAPPGPALPP
ncbi:hypothetical protein N7478_012029 [Penicillium angulare]|uniref:uncharacterized protein n=1 Tax=Penicillium angulare TaxID=116970 RepID=UPI0025411C5F|nr:uncharacterized protein N7478_012029 [Penicillium angulare]KAJ5261434.1 hypothetical protein N7478_012029 [Penicillium angulare]